MQGVQLTSRSKQCTEETDISLSIRQSADRGKTQQKKHYFDKVACGEEQLHLSKRVRYCGVLIFMSDREPNIFPWRPLISSL